MPENLGKDKMELEIWGFSKGPCLGNEASDGSPPIYSIGGW